LAILQERSNPQEEFMFIRTALLALTLLVPRVAQAACEQATHVSALSDAGRTAEVGFAALDAEALLTQASLARTQILPCVAQTLTKQDAAAFHRLMAMEAFIAGDYIRAKRELHASLLLQPGYTFPQDVAATGHPLLTLYKDAETMADGEGEKIYPPPGGYVLVGGVRNAARYSQTPVIIQVFTVEGDVATLRETRYVQPGEATPNWSGNAFGLTAADLGINLDDLKRPTIFKDPRPWYVAAGVATIAGGVLYGVALYEKSLYEDPTTSDDDLAALEMSANTLGTASLITGTTALAFTGLGVGFHVKFGVPARKSTLTTEISTP
jgi:hypothetical protein